MVSSIRAVWIPLLAVCSLLIIIVLSIGAIVLSLIPVYISKKDISLRDPRTISVGYATNVINGRSLTLANIDSISKQLIHSAGLSTGILNLKSASFSTTTSSKKKKRQTIIGNSSCERATNHTGDIFLAQYQFTYPLSCFLPSCRQQYLERIRSSLRMNYSAITTNMSFTNGETKTIQLVFCGFFNSNSTQCTTETRNNIYLLNSNNILYQFTPTTLNLTQIGSISCSTSASITSIALQRNGLIWVLMTDGKLYTYNIKSAQCTATAFHQNQTDIRPFTMAFVNNDLDNGETLYISKLNDGGNVLGKINMTTLTMSIVGSYSTGSSPDLAGTNDGRLFGLFYETSYIIKQINKTNGQILSQYRLGQSNVGNSWSPTLLAPYNSKFFLFAGYNNYIDISIFDPSTSITTKQTIAPQLFLIKAATSTCLGT